MKPIDWDWVKYLARYILTSQINELKDIKEDFKRIFKHINFFPVLKDMNKPRIIYMILLIFTMLFLMMGNYRMAWVCFGFTIIAYTYKLWIGGRAKYEYRKKEEEITKEAVGRIPKP